MTLSRIEDKKDSGEQAVRIKLDSSTSFLCYPLNTPVFFWKMELR